MTNNCVIFSAQISLRPDSLVARKCCEFSSQHSEQYPRKCFAQADYQDAWRMNYHKNITFELKFSVIFTCVYKKVTHPDMRILLVEDDGKTAATVSSVLEDSGHQTTVCTSAKEVLVGGLCNKHDLIILDLILEKERGEHLVTKLREQKVDIPILVTSALSEVMTKVNLLELGADDYLEKPFEYRELLARIEALKRRCCDASESEKEDCGNITFYWKHNEVARNGVRIPLTKKQGQLLRLLFDNRGRTVRSEDLLERVWKVKPGHHSNIVQSMIRRLRKQLDTNFPQKLIHSIHGVGYRLVLPGAEEDLKNSGAMKKVPKESLERQECA